MVVVYLNASEVSAAIGRNRFKTPLQLCQDIYDRTHGVKMTAELKLFANLSSSITKAAAKEHQFKLDARLVEVETRTADLSEKRRILVESLVCLPDLEQAKRQCDTEITRSNAEQVILQQASESAATDSDVARVAKRNRLAAELVASETRTTDLGEQRRILVETLGGMPAVEQSKHECDANIERSNSEQATLRRVVEAVTSDVARVADRQGLAAELVAAEARAIDLGEQRKVLMESLVRLQNLEHAKRQCEEDIARSNADQIVLRKAAEAAATDSDMARVAERQRLVAELIVAGTRVTTLSEQRRVIVESLVGMPVLERAKRRCEADIDQSNAKRAGILREAVHLVASVATEAVGVASVDAAQLSVVARVAEAVDATAHADMNAIAQVVSLVVNTTRGVLAEQALLDATETRNTIRITKRNTRMMYLKVGDSIQLGGRPDGIDDCNHVVVEVKQRRHKFLGCPIYERIQCELYMRMFRFRQCLLVERYEDESREHALTADDTLWHDIETGLGKFANTYIAWASQKEGGPRCVRGGPVIV